MCIFHKWELVGIFYEEYSPRYYNYGLKTLEVYRCKKCNREEIIIIDDYRVTFNMMYSDKIDSLKAKGIKDIIEYKINRINKVNN